MGYGRRAIHILVELLIVLALIIANGVFSGAEIAVVSMRRTRVQQLADEDRAGARALASLRADPERFLATIQVGITVVGTAAAAFGGARLASHVEPWLRPLPWVGPHARTAALVVMVVMVSFLSLVLGELVPKSLALRIGETYALVAAKALLAMSWVARPVVWVLTATSNLVLRPFSDRTDFVEGQLSRAELHQMVDEAARSGAVHEHAGELASRAIEFDKIPLRDAMIPRNRVDALPLRATAAQIRRFLLEERRSRIPVYEGSLDNVIGYVSAKDIVSIAWDGGLVVLQDLMRPVKFFPETLPAVEVLRSMRREGTRLAIAVDEHGVLSGLVTVEDLVEELVGDIISEHEDGPPPIVRNADGSAVVSGETPLRELNRELGLKLPESDDTITTVAGLCTRLGGGIPNRNARLAAEDGTVLLVMDATSRAVKRVRVIPPAPTEEQREAV